MDNIDIFYNSEIILKRKSFKIQYYIIFMSISIIIISLFLCFYKYQPYMYLQATVVKEDNSYYLKTYILEEKITDINSTYAIINGKRKKYEVKNISEHFILDEKNNKYYEIIISSEIDSKLIIDNNIVDINIELSKTTFVKKIIEKIKKGIK